MKSIFKIIAIILIQALIFTEIAICGSIDDSFRKSHVSAAFLSPQLNLQTYILQNAFNSQSTNKDEKLIPSSLLTEFSGLEDFADKIKTEFLENMDHLFMRISNKNSLKDVVAKMLEQINEKAGNFNPKDKCFNPGALILLIGLGGSGKTTIAREFVSRLRELSDYFVHPIFEFDYYILPKNERIIYYGSSPRNNFTKEQINKLIENRILREDKSDEYNLFWLTNTVNDDVLREKNFSQEDCSRILEIWEKVPLAEKKGATTEVVIEKFEIERYVRDVLKLNDGEVILRPVFDSSTRGRVKIGKDEDGTIRIYSGDKSLSFKNISELWMPVLVNGQGEAIQKQLGKFIFKTSETADREAVLGFEETKYIIKEDKIGIDMPRFKFSSELEKEQLKESSKVLSFVKDENGLPRIRFNGKDSDSVTIRTMDIKCHEAKQGENYIIHVNGIPHFVAAENLEKVSLIIDIDWIDLSNGQKVDLLERIIPGSGVLLFEGVGATADDRLVENAVTVNAYCDNEIRLYRMAIKRLKKEKRQEGILDNIERRGIMMYKEEMPFVIPWSEKTQYSITSMSLAEILWMLYRDGKLETEELLGVLKSLGIDAPDRDIIGELDAISERAIHEKLRQHDWYQKGKTFSGLRESVIRPSKSGLNIGLNAKRFILKYFKTDNILRRCLTLATDLLLPVIHLPFDEFYFVKRYHYGLVGEAAVDEQYLEDFYLPYFDHILSLRLGGILVRRGIFSFNKKIVAPGPQVSERMVRNFVVKNNVARSLLHDLRRKKEQGDLGDANKGTGAIGDLQKYIELQLSMLGQVEGEEFKLVDIDPNFGNYAFRQILDKQGHKTLKLNKLYHFTANPFYYSPDKYNWQNLVRVRISELEFEHVELIQKLLETEILKRDNVYPGQVSFSDNIKNEEELIELLKRNNVQGFWMQKVLSVYEKYPRFEWPELQQYYDEHLLQKLPGGRRAVLKNYLKRKTVKNARLIDPFDFDIMDKGIEFLNDRINEGRLHVMQELFLGYKQKYDWDRLESFIVWMNLYQFLLKKDEPELESVLGQIYETVKLHPMLLEENAWESELNKILADKFSDRTERIKDGIRRFEKMQQKTAALEKPKKESLQNTSHNVISPSFYRQRILKNERMLQSSI